MSPSVLDAGPAYTLINKEILADRQQSVVDPNLPEKSRTIEVEAGCRIALVEPVNTRQIAFDHIPFEAFLVFAELEFSRRMAGERGTCESQPKPGEWVDHGLV